MLPRAASPPLRIASATSPGAETHTHAAFTVAHHDERAEIEPASALDDLRGTVDEDNLLHQLFAALRVVINFGFRTATTTRTATTAAAPTAIITLLLLLRRGSLLRGRLPFRSAAWYYVIFVSHNIFSLLLC